MMRWHKHLLLSFMCLKLVACETFLTVYCTAKAQREVPTRLIQPKYMLLLLCLWLVDAA